MNLEVEKEYQNQSKNKNPLFSAFIKASVEARVKKNVT